MYKFGLLVLFIGSNFYGSLADPPPPNDVFPDVNVMFQKNLIECKQYCAKQDPKHDAQQTCKVFPDKNLVLSDCETQCMKFTKEETDKASTCTCVSGKCVGDTKPSQNAAPNDVFSDAILQKNLIECKQYCVKQDPKHDAQQTCKVFADKKLVLTDCEVQCMKFTKEETDKASTCPCVSGRCVGDTKPPQNSAIKYIPEIFSLMFVIYTVNYIV